MALSPSAISTSPLLSRDTIAAEQGAYFVATMPTPGTGLIGHAVNTTFVETKPVFMVYNAGSLTIYPQWLRMTVTVVATGNPTVLQTNFTTVMDQGNRFSAFVTGSALTPVNSNFNSTVTSAAQVSAGAITATAPTANRRLMSHIKPRPLNAGGTINAPVVGDVYQMSFGLHELVDICGLPNDSTTRVHTNHVMAPLVLPPGMSLLLYTWSATFSAGATYEYELGYVEK